MKYVALQQPKQVWKLNPIEQITGKCGQADPY